MESLQALRSLSGSAQAGAITCLYAGPPKWKRAKKGSTPQIGKPGRAEWLRRLDAAVAVPGRERVAAWWPAARAGALATPSVGGLATCLVAAGAPSLPSGVLQALRDDFTAAFVDTFCELFMRRRWAVRRMP